jgi:hypothetical protein
MDSFTEKVAKITDRHRTKADDISKWAYRITVTTTV